MINFEGALSSRRKRAGIIIAWRGEKSRTKRKKNKMPAVYLTAEGGKMKYSIGLEFSPAGKRKRDRILARPLKNARKKNGIPKPTRLA
jgi:hypothetical protein